MTKLISVYPDGSYTKAEQYQQLPAKAGRGLVALYQTDDRVLCQLNNVLMLDLYDIHYRAKHKHNKTRVATAIGEVLEWIHKQPPDTVSAMKYVGWLLRDRLGGRHA